MSMHIETFAHTLTIQYSYTSYVFNANLDGLTEAQAFTMPEPGGNCANWVAGHIVQARGATVAMLGQECPFDLKRYESYVRGSNPLAADAESTVALSQMVEDFSSTDAPLRVALGELTDELLAQEAPFSPGNDPNETVGSLLAGLVFHEAYHCGQLGVIRRLAGMDGAIS